MDLFEIELKFVDELGLSGRKRRTLGIIERARWIISPPWVIGDIENSSHGSVCICRIRGLSRALGITMMEWRFYIASGHLQSLSLCIFAASLTALRRRRFWSHHESCSIHTNVVVSLRLIAFSWLVVWNRWLRIYPITRQSTLQHRVSGCWINLGSSQNWSVGISAALRDGRGRRYFRIFSQLEHFFLESISGIGNRISLCLALNYFARLFPLLLEIPIFRVAFLLRMYYDSRVASSPSVLGYINIAHCEHFLVIRN